MVHQEMATPRFRVQVLGDFLLEKCAEDGRWDKIETGAWGKTYGRLLFKRLLSAKARRAARGILLEDLWPDASLGEKYLNDAATKLRHLLSSPGGSLLTTFGTHSASGYALPDQSILWTDADEALALLKEAEEIGRTSAQGLRLLEQAAQLFERGEYLEEETGLWCHARRATIERLAYRCQLWLAEVYRAQGQVGQAEIRYRHLLEDDPTDEDVLCHLIALLYEQGMIHEAQRCFAESKRMAQQMGIQFSDRIEAFVASCSHETLHSAPMGPALLPPPKKKLLSQHDALPYLLTQFETAIISSSALAHFDVSTFVGDSIVPDTLPVFASLNDICRHLSEGHELRTAEAILWSYLPRVESFVKEASQDDDLVQAASIVSQSYLLAASLVGHRNDLHSRHQYSQHALFYSKLAQDHNVHVVALRQLAISFDCMRRPDLVVPTYQQVFPYMDQISPLLRACIYADLSGAHAQLGHAQEAARFIGLAYEHFPPHPELEPGYLQTICRYSSLLQWEGLNFLVLGQPHEAEKVFARLDGLHPHFPLPERVRVELLNYQVEVFIALRKLEQACTYLEVAAQTASTIGSERLLHEASTHLHTIQNIWPHDRRVQHVRDVFMHVSY